MIQFEVDAEHKPGSLARVCDALTKDGVNLISVSTEIRNGGIIKLITTNDLATKSALTKAGFKFRERQIVAVELIDEPGELGRLSKELSDRGVNIESVFLLDRTPNLVRLAIKTDNLEKTIQAIERIERKYQ